MEIQSTTYQKETELLPEYTDKKNPAVCRCWNKNQLFFSSMQSLAIHKTMLTRSIRHTPLAYCYPETAHTLWVSNCIFAWLYIFLSKLLLSIKLYYFLVHFSIRYVNNVEIEWYILRITLYYKGGALKSFGGKTLKLSIVILLAHSKENTCINLSCQGEMMGHLWSAFLSSTELAGYLSPSRGDSRLSPATVVRIARHCGRVLGQARTLGRLSNSVEPCFPHWCTLPHPSAPLFLSALHTTAAAPVQSVYLRRRGNSL